MFNNYKKRLIYFYLNQLKKKNFIIKFKIQILLKLCKKIKLYFQHYYKILFRVKSKVYVK